TVLTETGAMLFITASALAATLAIKASSQLKRELWWALAGLLGGVATLFRPDSAFFVAAARGTPLLTGLHGAYSMRGATVKRSPRQRLAVTFAQGLTLSVAFAVVLAPWTIRNARVFGDFQPIAPASANMPDEFTPFGYMQWLRTWVTDERYVIAFEDGLNAYPIQVGQIPHFAFDSIEERERVAEVFDRYENPQPESGSEDIAEDDSDGSEPNQISDSGAGSDQPEFNVRMTPEIDSAFGEIARRRIARHPLRYYL